MKVLHLNTEKEFRGGERQLIFLVENRQQDVIHYLAANKSGQLIKKLDIPSFQWKGKSPYKFLELWKLHKWVVENEIQIIHAHSSKGHTIGFLLKILNKKLKLIATKRTAFASNNYFSSWKFKSTDKIVAVSRAVQKNIKSHSVVIYDGIKSFEGKDEDLRDILKLDSQSILVGTIAALTEEKNIEGFLRVANSVTKSNENIFFVWIGDGKLRDKIPEMRSNQNDAERVFFVGFKENPQRYIKSLNVFFFPSLNEGLGSSVLDAFSIGTPVVSSNAGGLDELITHGKNGLKSNVNDESKMVSNIESLLSSSELRNTISKDALNFSKSFSIENMSSQYLTLYRDLCPND